MKSMKKFIVEMEGRAVYASRSYENVRRVAWKLIRCNKDSEVIVHLSGIICGI